MFTDCVHLSIAWKGTTLAYVDANYVESPVIGCASETVYAF